MFRVRIVHFGEEYYMIQYANSKFLWMPIWKTLHRWFEQGHPGGTEGWYTNLFGIKEAERLAATLKSSEDVAAYYEPHMTAMRKWKQEEREFIKNNIPYKSKRIL